MNLANYLELAILLLLSAMRFWDRNDALRHHRSDTELKARQNETDAKIARILENLTKNDPRG